MKKIFLILALLTGFLAARADNTLTVTSGNPKILKEKTSALVVFDWEGATWDHENSLEEQWGADYAKILSKSEATFVAEFNKKSKGLKLDTSIEDSSVCMTVKISNADKHWAWGMVTSIWGTVTVTNDNKSVLSIDMEKMEGEGDNSSDDSVARTFQEIAKKLTKLK